MTNLLEYRDFFKDIIREAFIDVIREERMTLLNVFFPYVSEEENKDIENTFGSPENYKKEDFVDMTDWIFNVS